MSRSQRRPGKSAGRYNSGARTLRHQTTATMVRDSDSIRLAVHGTQAIGNPADAVSKAISDALDPTKAPSKPKTFSQMSEAEREEMRRLYERDGR